jgi:hypothetical protein
MVGSKRGVRDVLLASGALVNTGGERRFVLYAAGDPLLEQVRPYRGAPGTHFEIDTGSAGESASAPRVPPIRGRRGADALSGEPE